jgi:hypothetical protein
MSHVYKVAVPVTVGALGICLSAIAIDYPNPFYPYLSLLLLAANLFGFYATRIRRCSWLRWLVLFVTLFVQQIWAFKLGMTLFKHESPAAFLAREWFVPVVLIMTAVLLLIATIGILRSGTERISRFDLSLPTINVVWGFLLVQYVMVASGGNKMLLGMFGLTVAAGHLAVAFWLGSRGVERAPGTNAFVAAGGILLALSLPAAAGNSLTTLPIISGLAFGMALASDKWQSGGVRATSYAFQAYVAGSLFVLLRGTTMGGDALTGGVVAATIAGIAFIHYRWCRSNSPPAASRFFDRYDKHDAAAAMPLLAFLAGSYFVVSALLLAALKGQAGDPGNMLSCSQTAIINCAAALIMILASSRKSRELRNIAILLTVVGGVKVFLYDLLGGGGLPRVLSLFSFGLAAALESLLLGRWQLQASRTREEN